MSQNYVLAITIQYWWAHLEVQRQDIEANWMQIFFSAQNYPNAPFSSLMGLGAAAAVTRPW